MQPIIQEKTARIVLGQVDLVGDLTVPDRATGLVIFAHGSGSSRLSPRNRYVAALLQKAGLATLLIDLLTVAEGETDSRNGQFRFDIPLLARRMIGVIDWLKGQAALASLSLGLFGASTGSAAALIAAAARTDSIAAVVSRGGRPDLAVSTLPDVSAPTLLIVGGEDDHVIELNRKAFDLLKGTKELKIVPGATHLFEEPGAMERVVELTTAWYRRHLK